MLARLREFFDEQVNCAHLAGDSDHEQDIRLATAALLIEVARAEDGYTPEPSFGTHFFQELVEAGILYLPLYPDDEGTIFNEPFLHGSPNALATLSPGDADLASVIRVIDLTEVAPGRTLELAMDGDSQQALAYLKG